MGEERATNLRRLIVSLMLIVLITLSATVGVLVAYWPEWVRYFGSGR